MQIIWQSNLFASIDQVRSFKQAFNGVCFQIELPQNNFSSLLQH